MTSAEAIALIEAAGEPGDLSGYDATRCYRRLARLTHPGDSRAASAFARLAALWQQHQEGCGPRIARGDIADLYRMRQGLLKLARDPADNDLMRREAAALTQLQGAHRQLDAGPDGVVRRRLHAGHSAPPPRRRLAVAVRVRRAA